MPQQPSDNPRETGSAEQTAKTGNASNPSPLADEPGPQNVQAFPEKAETYLREAGNIEDLPDAKDEEDMEETLKREKTQ